jgi:hypothetical protein
MSYYTVNRLTEELRITTDDVKNLIELGYLLPDGWDGYSESQRRSAYADDYNYFRWDGLTVDRFKKFLEYSDIIEGHNYTSLANQINLVAMQTMAEFKSLSGQILNLRREFSEFVARVERREAMIDFRYFAGKTGYSEQTLRNAVVYADPKHLTCRVQIRFYQDLIWHKINGRWKTSLLGFEELRSGFQYETWLEEDRRQGKPRRLHIIEKDSGTEPDGQ